MRVCPKCGYREKVPWRGSRFDFNGEYLRFDEAQTIPELHKICTQLLSKNNFERIVIGSYSYYRRGTGGLYLYRVPNEDFKVPRERKRHSNQRKKLLENTTEAKK